MIRRAVSGDLTRINGKTSEGKEIKKQRPRS